jgi:hypothetical protein
VAGVGVHGECRQDGLLPALDLVGDLGPGADQGHVLHQLEGDRGDGALPVAGQVEVLDLGRSPRMNAAEATTSPWAGRPPSCAGSARALVGA